MSNLGYMFSLILVTWLVTWGLRAFPFLLFGSGRKLPAVIGYIGKMLAPATIAMLVVYCFGCYVRDRAPAMHGWGAAELAAALVVVGLQLWKRNPLVSIIAGTVVYMILVQRFFPAA